MDRPLLWLAGLLVSLIAIVATVFGVVGVFLAVLLVVLLARRTDGRVAVSGLLTGFGSIWLILLVAEARSGGVLQDAVFWTTLGVVILAAGLGLLASIVVRKAAV
jgi:hypothetical protein